MADSTTTGSRPVDEAARRRFEAAWRAGQPGPLEQFLPPADDPAYRGTLEEFVLIDLEFTWKAHRAGGTAEPPRVEAYLARFPLLNDTTVLPRLIREEFRLRREGGDTPSLDEYRARFPRAITDDSLLTVTDTGKPRGVVTALCAGDRLGRYRLGAEHARGGFGLVWRADDDVLGREVALKQLSSRLAGEPVHRRRFLAEARIAAQLQHPGVVPVYDLGGAESPHPFYAMKLVRGQTFAEAISHYHAESAAAGGRAVQFLRLLEAFLAVAQAAAFAHARGVIHRDLKPANIVLGEYGETVILDWGLAKVVRGGDSDEPGVTPTPMPATASGSDVTQDGTIVGTPAYMAPEQARGEIDFVDERSDVYALGAILYQLLTGRPPYDGHPAAVLHRVGAGDPPPRPRTVDPGISRPLEAVCRKAMAADPGRRYQSADELARDIERFLAGEPVSAYPEPPAARLARFARRHTTAVTAAAVAVVLSLIGGAAGVIVWDRAEQRRARDVADRVAERRNAAATDEGLALAELRAGQFAQAVTLLDNAIGRLGDEPQLTHLRPALDRRRDRTRRLATFYRQLDRGERLAFLDRDEPAQTACEDALRQLGLLSGHPANRWWEQLPADDLQPDQRLRLQDDAAHALLLLGGIRGKRTLQAIGGPTVGPAARAVLDTIPPVQAYHEWRWGRPAYTSRLFELVARFVLGEGKQLPALGPPDPVAASDCYFTGFVYLWCGMFPRPLLPLVLSQDLVDRLSFGDRPLRTQADEMFRRAVALDPQHYWSHLWLGLTLRLADQLPGAEQEYNACLALRPESALALTLRAEGRLVRAKAGAADNHARGLWEQVRADAARALADDPDDPLTHWLSAQALDRLGETPAALDAAARALELELPPAPGDLGALLTQAIAQSAMFDIWSSGLDRRPRQIQAWAAQIAQRRPNDPDAPAVEALAALCARQPAAAVAAADRALALAPWHARARAVRGGALLAQNRPREALVEFRAALADHPRDYLTGAGLARAYEAAGDFDLALTEFDALLVAPPGGRAPAFTDWQQLEVHLGRARTLTRLGRVAESERALAAAVVFNWGATLQKRTGLYPYP